MNTEKAKTLVCPWTFNQNGSTRRGYECATTLCMAWEEDGYLPMPEDPTIKIFLGHCKLIDKE